MFETCSSYVVGIRTLGLAVYRLEFRGSHGDVADAADTLLAVSA